MQQAGSRGTLLFRRAGAAEKSNGRGHTRCTPWAERSAAMPVLAAVPVVGMDRIGSARSQGNQGRDRERSAEA